ncbi:MAG: penicillin-binding Tp47 domain C-containing protein, partial [Agathobaculum butyriciproducens]
RIVIRGGADAVSIKNTTAGKGVLVSSPNGAAAISVSGGSVGTVTAKSDLSLSGSVSNVAVTDKATLTVEKNASVGTVTVSAAGSKVTGDGKVTNVQANANNVTVTSKGAKVTAGSGVSGVKAGDKAVESGKSETVGTASSSGGSSSGGGSSSSRSDYSYVLMNIPYGEFYKAELNENAAAVDAVSSATKNKTRIGTLAGGSYHVNPDGSDITGVTYPVRVKTSDLSGLKKVTDSDSVSITVNKKGKDETSTYTGKEALFESASYSYYALSSTPSYYKEATLTDGKWSFGKATGAASEDTATIAKFKTSGHHADYEMKVESDKITKGQKVYAVVLTDTDGNTYGLHHVTEIWRATELGFESDSALGGKTISAVTYYTDDGVIKLKLAEKLYVPHIAKDAKAEVAKFDADAKETTLTLSGFPEDFAQNVKVPDGMSYADGKIKFGSALPGSYTVTVSDAKGKYADVTASFTVSTSKAAAKYDASSVALKKADSAEDADFTNFLKNITSVKVGDKKYAATDKDAVTIIKKDGAIDEDAKSNNEALFADGKEKTLTVSAAGYPDLTFSYTPTYTYAYAAVPYDEYWQSEGVYLNKGSEWDAGFDARDGHNEYDKGAFDAVSRATTNHGLHRGSFQQSVVIHTADKDYYPVAWTDGDNFVDADGKTYNKKEIGITSYNITGIKYVPVKVSSSDFADFCKQYTVTKNGETLQGGYSEFNLNAYTAVAAVDKDTNGLKEVTLGSNGYTFGARQTGEGSGIKGEALKTADKAITAAAKEYSGNFGEMLRVDLNNNYGDLGGHMQTVVWKYYGTDEKNTTPLATYGTKFAADNWMHKTMGIQLGLTDSLRAKLPDGKDGTGKWTITVYALGYSDTTYTVNVAAENLPKKVELMTEKQKEQLESLRDQAKKLLDAAADQNNLTPKEAELKKHYDEIVALLAKSGANSVEAQELIDEVPKLIKDVEDARKQPTKPDKPTTETKTITGKITPKDDDDGNIDEGYNFSFDVTLQDGTIINISNDTTDAGGNKKYWKWATTEGHKGITGLFTSLLNKTASEIGNVDAVTGATVSSNAIKTAVKNALSND